MKVKKLENLENKNWLNRVQMLQFECPSTTHWAALIRFESSSPIFLHQPTPNRSLTSCLTITIKVGAPNCCTEWLSTFLGGWITEKYNFGAYFSHVACWCNMNKSWHSYIDHICKFAWKIDLGGLDSDWTIPWCQNPMIIVEKSKKNSVNQPSCLQK